MINSVLMTRGGGFRACHGFKIGLRKNILPIVNLRIAMKIAANEHMQPQFQRIYRWIVLAASLIENSRELSLNITKLVSF